jgi:nucleotide-binding universal stress UspA family protein
MYKHVLIPTDGSELADKAVDEGLRFAKWANATVTCLFVNPHFHTRTEGGEGFREAADKVMERLHEDDLRKHAQEVLDPVAKQSAASGVKCETLSVVSDRPADAIVDTAKQRGCDLIIMASHGRSGVKALVLGSETMNVLTNSKIPVLVLR